MHSFFLSNLGGGNIFLECEPRGSVCHSMKGGKVVIPRNINLTEGELGNGMEGGEIVVEGNFYGRSLGCL